MSTACNDELTTKCHRLVNRALRVALKADRSTSVNDLYDTTHVLKFDLLDRFNIIKLMKSKVYTTGTNDSVDVNVINTNLDNMHLTRSLDAPVFGIPFPNSSRFLKSYIYNGSIA